MSSQSFNISWLLKLLIECSARPWCCRGGCSRSTVGASHQDLRPGTAQCSALAERIGPLLPSLPQSSPPSLGLDKAKPAQLPLGIQRKVKPGAHSSCSSWLVWGRGSDCPWARASGRRWPWGCPGDRRAVCGTNQTSPRGNISFETVCAQVTPQGPCPALTGLYNHLPRCHHVFHLLRSARTSCRGAAHHCDL